MTSPCTSTCFTHPSSTTQAPHCLLQPIGVGSNFILGGGGGANLRMAAPLGRSPPHPRKIKFASLNALRSFLGQFCKCYSNHQYTAAQVWQAAQFWQARIFGRGLRRCLMGIYSYISKQARKTGGSWGMLPQEILEIRSSEIASGARRSRAHQLSY